MPDDRELDERRRFGEMSIDDMNAAQRAVNDWLVDYLRPGQSPTPTPIGGPMAAFLHSPKLAEIIGRLVTLVFDDLCLPRKMTELAILLTARHWGCNYEFDTHRRYAARFGINSHVVETIALGQRPLLEGEMSDVFDFVSQLLERGDVSDVVFGRVADRWGRQGAVELIASVGFYTMIAFVLNVDRYPVPAERRLPPLNPPDGEVPAEAHGD